MAAKRPLRSHVVFYGLGPVGRSIAHEIVRRAENEVVGAVDRDRILIGRDLGEILGDTVLGVEVGPGAAEMLAETRPHLVVLTTTSSAETILPQILEIVSAGAAVVTTCEELSYPWATNGEIAGEIDDAARKAGVAVLSTGVNPGFLMDFLPATLTGLCRDVERVEVERRMDAGPRRQAFRDKIGAGTSVEEFARRVEKGDLRHVGLTESVHLIAAALGWELDGVSETIEPVLAEGPVENGQAEIAEGRVTGVLQIARGLVTGRETIRLVFRSAVGLPEPYDRVVIEGTPPIDVRFAGGVHGDLATCNLVVHAIPAVLAAAPGLRTMLDLPLTAWRAGGGS